MARILNPVTCMEWNPRQNPKNVSATNKLSYYIKKQGHDAYFNESRHHLSSKDESPSKHESPMPSDREVEDKLSNGSRSNSNFSS
jgi:hypothetical protein